MRRVTVWRPNYPFHSRLTRPRKSAILSLSQHDLNTLPVLVVRQLVSDLAQTANTS